MHDSVHQKQDDMYPHPDSAERQEEKVREDNNVTNPRPTDVTEDENIIEVDEAAGSAEGMPDRDNDLGIMRSVEEDREGNNEGRLPDIPPSAIHQ